MKPSIIKFPFRLLFPLSIVNVFNSVSSDSAFTVAFTFIAIIAYFRKPNKENQLHIQYRKVHSLMPESVSPNCLYSLNRRPLLVWLSKKQNYCRLEFKEQSFLLSNQKPNMWKSQSFW